MTDRHQIAASLTPEDYAKFRHTIANDLVKVESGANARWAKYLNTLLKARQSLLRDHPFYGAIAYNTELYLDPTDTFPSAATDGKKIIFPRFFIDMFDTNIELKAVYAHELLHVAHMHPFRGKRKENVTWQTATDYAINILLEDQGMKLPGQGLVDENYRGMSAEEIYNLIYEEPDQDGEDGEGETDEEGDGGDKTQQPTSDPTNKPPNDDKKPATAKGPEPGTEAGTQLRKSHPSNIGLTLDASQLMTEAEVKSLETKATISLSQATIQQRLLDIGDEAAKIETTNKTHLGFKEELTTFISSNAEREDYSWSRPNPRYQPHILPSIGSTDAEEKPNYFQILIDVSGSIQVTQLQRFCDAINDIFTQLPHIKVDIIYFDWIVQETITDLDSNDLPFKLQVMGGGGTNYQPPFAEAERLQKKNDVKPNGIIVFTDLYCNQWPPDPGIPTVWLDFSGGHSWYVRRSQIPFGKQITMEAPEQ